MSFYLSQFPEPPSVYVIYLQFLEDGSSLFDLSTLLFNIGQGLCQSGTLYLYIDLCRKHAYFMYMLNI